MCDTYLIKDFQLEYIKNPIFPFSSVVSTKETFSNLQLQRYSSMFLSINFIVLTFVFNYNPFLINFGIR